MGLTYVEPASLDTVPWKPLQKNNVEQKNARKLSNTQTQYRFFLCISKILHLSNNLKTKLLSKYHHNLYSDSELTLHRNKQAVFVKH